MKVLFIANIPSPYRVTFFNLLGRECDLTVAFEGRVAADRNAEWFAESATEFTPIFMNGKAVNQEQFFCPEVISVLRKGYDAIILGGYSSPTAMLAIAWLKLHNIPFYLEADGGIVRAESKAKYWLKRSLISAADSWISSGQRTDQYFLHYGAKKERLYRHPFSSLREADILPAPPTYAEKQALRQALGLAGQKVVLSIGQFIPRKGFDVLLRAAALLPPDTCVHIIGGTPTEEYRQLADQLRLTNVYFHGFQSKAALSDFYKAADLFVLPTREDIWGLVVNEAMACGLSVITTDNCVAGLELIRDGVNGYIVPVEDHRLLSDRIRQITPDDAVSMGQAALETIRAYTIENMVRAHMEILHHRS